jgi:sugar (pentulose or hexulose) kinase
LLRLFQRHRRPPPCNSGRPTRCAAISSIAILGSGFVGAPLAGMVADMVGVPVTYSIIAALCAGTAAAAAGLWLKDEYRASDRQRLDLP